MGRIIAIANQKGGVGKTTTAINLSASLAAAEGRVLLIDCDPQSNSTSGIGLGRTGISNPSESIENNNELADNEPYLLPEDEVVEAAEESSSNSQPLTRWSTYNLLMGECTVEEAMLSTAMEGLTTVPASKNLIGANVELVAEEDRAFRMRLALDPIRDRFDFIILDCPPALDLLTLNCLVAADSVLIPMQAEYFALEGVTELLDTVERIRQDMNPALEIEGAVLTMFDERTNLAQQVAKELRRFFKEKLFRTTIPRNIKLAEAPSYGRPVLDYDPRSRGAEAYIRLAKELLDRQDRRLKMSTEQLLDTAHGR